MGKAWLSTRVSFHTSMLLMRPEKASISTARSATPARMVASAFSLPAVGATRVPLPIGDALQRRRAPDLASALDRRARDRLLDRPFAHGLREALRGHARKRNASEQAARVASNGDVMIGQQSAKIHEDCARV